MLRIDEDGSSLDLGLGLNFLLLSITLTILFNSEFMRIEFVCDNRKLGSPMDQFNNVLKNILIIFF